MSRKRIEKNLAYDDEKRLYYAYFDYGKDESGARVRRTQTFEERDRAKEALYRFEVEHLQYRHTPLISLFYRILGLYGNSGLKF